MGCTVEIAIEKYKPTNKRTLLVATNGNCENERSERN